MAEYTALIWENKMGASKLERKEGDKHIRRREEGKNNSKDI